MAAAIGAWIAVRVSLKTLAQDTEDRFRQHERERSAQARQIRLPEPQVQGSTGDPTNGVYVFARCLLTNGSLEPIRAVELALEVEPIGALMPGKQDRALAKERVVAPGASMEVVLMTYLRWSDQNGGAVEHNIYPTLTFTDHEGVRWHRNGMYQLSELDPATGDAIPMTASREIFGSKARGR